MPSRRTAYPDPVLEEVRGEVQEAETGLQEALRRLEEQTQEDTQRADWRDVPALEASDGHETTSDTQLRGALNDARDALAEAEDLLTHMLEPGEEDASDRTS